MDSCWIIHLPEFLNSGNILCSCVGKLFCSILDIRLLEFVQARNMLHPSQIGFLPANRTSDHLFSLKTLKGNGNKKFYCLI